MNIEIFTGRLVRKAEELEKDARNYDSANGGAPCAESSQLRICALALRTVAEAATEANNP